MKGIAVYPAKKSIALVDVPEPRLQSPTQALVRMLEVGICGTDKEIARFDYGTPPRGSDFLVIGHEGLGVVQEVGPRVRKLNPGDLVVPTVRRPCGAPTCTPCAMGRQDFCATGNFKERGIKELHGFMTELIVEEEGYLHKVPPELRDIAVLTEPLTISVKSLRQIRNIQDRLPWACRAPSAGKGASGRTPEVACHRALVLGAGPVGLLGAMVLLRAGFATAIYSRVGQVPQRVDLARAIGAEFIAAEDHPVSDFCERLGQVDVIFEAVGASQLAFDALQLLRANAIFVFTGVPGRKGKASINTDMIMRNMVLKNQDLVGSVNAAPEDFEEALDALADFKNDWPGVPARIKTRALSLDQVPEVLKGGSREIKQYVALEQA